MRLCVESWLGSLERAVSVAASRKLGVDQQVYQNEQVSHINGWNLYIYSVRIYVHTYVKVRTILFILLI